MIETWREAVVESAAFHVGWGGLLIGLAFGYLVYVTNFCTMGSISDILSFGSYNRFRAWLLACAVAILGVAGIEALGVADMSESMYQTTALGWAANFFGGLIFGFGMVFAGGCISRNLVRSGGGDLRSLVVLMITGIFAFMTIGGILGPLRLLIFDPGIYDLSQAGMETQHIGAALMGIGGVLALGCTVGQALTGFSTLAIGSAITFISIVIGGIAGVKTIERFA